MDSHVNQKPKSYQNYQYYLYSIFDSYYSLNLKPKYSKTQRETKSKNINHNLDVKHKINDLNGKE